MKYMGSKNRISKYILPIILKDRQPEQFFVDVMCGGCNIIDKVPGNRIANDSNKYLITMFTALIAGDLIPSYITREEYVDMRNNKLRYPDSLIGWAGFNCSYSGKFFSGFAGEIKTKDGKYRNFQQEAIRNIYKQIKNLIGVEFRNENYCDLFIPIKSIVYADPPYEGTTQYSTKFEHKKFWDWCREINDSGHKIFISEYNAPSDFKCVWEGQVKSSLSANGIYGGNKVSTEKLFTL